MRARDRRYGKTTVKTRVGIATAILVGGAVAAGAALAANHGAAATATSAAFSSHAGTEGTVLSSAMTNWNGSRQSSYAQLARLSPGHGVRRIEGARGIEGRRGMVPAHPRGTRVRRRSWRHEGLSGRTHQWVATAVGMTTGVAPFPAAAWPAVAALSGANRTS